MTNPFLDPEIANDYDTIYRTREGKYIDYFEKASMDKLLRNLPRGKLLEVGCGTGRWSNFFSSLGFDVTGIDSSLPMLEIARKKKLPFTNFIHTSGESYFLPKPQNIKLIRKKEGILSRKKYEDESWKFDSLALMFSLEFIENLERVFENCLQFINSNGFIIIGLFNSKSDQVSRILSKKTFPYAHLRSLTEISQFLSKYGKVSVEKCIFPTFQDYSSSSLFDLIEQEHLMKENRERSNLIYFILIKISHEQS
ncbi:Ubiquinone biosynthesis O-methyltransferase, mitochondrial [Candidatus Lokiarchaeum ossiferum]|uniref:Ubiquinone biosynthesis O-methyltransferase, mitochondrial n=1 Tax=Candidatus Lokiarchaeum ossiferum TaxID=2951803 RepID=A0ABY6HQS0_9ARCH|nr:Ubiquinone biosynthesis O-methyltransferase, mitochondrial [Candidatus Lokiarchaeum sp. B-35]